MPGLGGLPLNGEEHGLAGCGPSTLASGTGAQGQRGEDEEMAGDVGAWGEHWPVWTSAPLDGGQGVNTPFATILTPTLLWQ